LAAIREADAEVAARRTTRLSKQEAPGRDRAVTGEPGAPFEIFWAAPAKRALRRLPEKVAAAAVEFTYGPWPAARVGSGGPCASSSRACTAPTGATTGSCAASTRDAGGSRFWWSTTGPTSTGAV